MSSIITHRHLPPPPRSRASSSSQAAASSSASPVSADTLSVQASEGPRTQPPTVKVIAGPLTLGTAIAGVSVAGIAAAAVFFPVLLAAIVPVALIALGLVALYAKRQADAVKAASYEPGIELVERAVRPAKPLPPEMLRIDNKPKSKAADDAAKADAFLTFLRVPGRYTPDVLLASLAHARGCNARLWVRTSDGANDMWASLDVEGRYFATDGAERTLHFVNDGEHYRQLALHAQANIEDEETGGTVVHTLRREDADDVDTPADGDCMFHAWAMAENYNGYNELAADNVAARHACVNALRNMAIDTARDRVTQGDTTLSAELARSMEREFNLHWMRGGHSLDLARVYPKKSKSRAAFLELARQALQEAQSLLTSGQTEVRALLHAKMVQISSL